MEDALQLSHDGLVLHRDHAGRREAGHDLAREVRARQHAARVAGQDLADHLRHAQVALLFEPLGQADDRHPGPDAARNFLQDIPEAVRGHAHHDDVGLAHDLVHRGARPHRARKRLARQVALVGVAAVDLVCDVGAARPEQRRNVVTGEGGYRRAHDPAPITATRSCTMETLLVDLRWREDTRRGGLFYSAIGSFPQPFASAASRATIRLFTVAQAAAGPLGGIHASVAVDRARRRSQSPDRRPCWLPGQRLRASRALP